MTPHRYRCRRCQQVWARRGDVPSCCPGCHTHDQALFLDITSGDTQMTRLRGAMSPNPCIVGQMTTFSTWGANMVRYQLYGTRGAGDPIYRDLDVYDSWLAANLDILDGVLDECTTVGIKVVVDMHRTPGGRDSQNAQAIWYEQLYKDSWLSWWQTIARRYKGHPAVWAFDLVNEPAFNALSAVTGSGPLSANEYWTGQEEVAAAIHAIDPDVVVVMAPKYGSAATGFVGLAATVEPNVVYTLHNYVPASFTHQGISGRPEPVTYPGVINGEYWDKNRIRMQVQPVRDFQIANSARIYVGEFSSLRYAPGADQYIQDSIEIFESFNWDWTYHAYRESQLWDAEMSTTKGDLTRYATTARKSLLTSYYGRNHDPYA